MFAKNKNKDVSKQNTQRGKPFGSEQNRDDK